MYELKPNSHKSKQEDTPSKDDGKKFKPVVKSGRTQKKGGLGKLAGSIISEDAQNVKSYIVMDVLIPSIKKAISDIVINGIDIILGHMKKTIVRIFALG